MYKSVCFGRRFIFLKAALFCGHPYDTVPRARRRNYYRTKCVPILFTNPRSLSHYTEPIKKGRRSLSALKTHMDYLLIR